jgi:hypothetical protein
MSTVKSKKLQVGTDATSSNNFTIYQPATPDGTLRIGVGNADSPTEVGQFNANGYKPAVFPAFSAVKPAYQTISASTTTKVTFNTEQWDLTSDYDTATSRFTPSVSGYYQFNSSFYFLAPVDGGVTQIQLVKNGSVFKWGNILTAAGTQSHSPLLSATAYANGTTDYFEIYIWQNSGTKNISGSTTLTWFDGHLIQQA